MTRDRGRFEENQRRHFARASLFPPAAWLPGGGCCITWRSGCRIRAAPCCWWAIRRRALRAARCRMARNSAHLREGSAGARRDRGAGSTFRARGKKRVAALAFGIFRSAAPDFFGAWRTQRAGGFARRHRHAIPLAGRGASLFADFRFRDLGSRATSWSGRRGSDRRTKANAFTRHRSIIEPVQRRGCL